MWQTFVLEEKCYLFQFISSSTNIIINVSDLQQIWSMTAPINEVISNFKELNPLLSQDANELRESCYVLMNEQFIKSLNWINDDQLCQVRFKKFLEELPLNLEITLTRKVGEFLQQVTVPMIQTLQYLELKQQKLERLLKEKDKELDEYKVEFEQISRKYLTTTRYEPDTAIKSTLLLNTFTQNMNFNSTFARNHGDVQQLFPEVKMEVQPEKRKLELAPIKNKKRK